MANFNRAPKQWCLTKTETINSFENWRQNLAYTLSLDTHFVPFLIDGVTWGKKTRTSPLRDLVDDGEDVPEARRKTAEQKVSMLELMLGQIANYCGVISRNTIVKNSTSMSSIWQVIRLHYGFQTTGGHFLDFSDIHQNPEEHPEDLFQRLSAFVEDNLLCRNNGITHHGAEVEEDEEMSPSLENFVVLTWLHLLHPDLPRLIKQRYGTELQSRTLASIKPEISQALSSLLDEVHTSEDVKIMRTATSRFDRKNKQFPQRQRTPISRESTSFKVCVLCKAAGRVSNNHFLSQCSYLPAADRKYMARARHIANILDDTDSPKEDVTNDDTTFTFDQVTNTEIGESARAYGLSLEIGRVKNCNKNPVAERAIQELEHELLSQDPVGGSITSLTPSVAIANQKLRTCIHYRR